MRSLRMGGDKLPPGPEGRGPFDASDTFVLPDGRSYTPGDACTDDIYGCHPAFSHPALAEKCGPCVRCGARCGALARAGRGARGGGPGAGVVLPPRARPWGSRWWWATAMCQRVPMCMLDCAHACRRVRATRHKQGVYITLSLYMPRAKSLAERLAVVDLCEVCADVATYVVVCRQGAGGAGAGWR